MDRPDRIRELPMIGRRNGERTSVTFADPPALLDSVSGLRLRWAQRRRELAAMLTVPIVNRQGEKVGEESIDPADFGGKINKQLLHEVVLMHLAARRVGTVNTRGRADVAGSGKKLFRQKGTGNARAGSKRTNKRRGGGVAFARRNRDYRYAIPKRAVRAAIRMAILSKFQDNQAVILEDLPINRELPKTKDFVATLRKIRRPDYVESAKTDDSSEGGTGEPNKTQALKATLDRRSILLGLSGHDPVAHRAARNIEGMMVAPVADFNTYDVLKQRYLVLTRESLKTLLDRAKTLPARRATPSDAAAAQS